MDLYEAIQKRVSVRRWADKSVEEEKVRRVMEAARLAPSAKNLQEWRFIVVTDPTLREKLGVAARNQEFVGQAPVVIAGVATDTKNVMACGQHSYPIDLAIAMEHIALAAAAEGLGTCWIGAFYEDQVKRALRIPPAGTRVVALMPLGYPAPDLPAPKKSRKAYEDVVLRDCWK
jgi:nitroreductase